MPALKLNYTLNRELSEVFSCLSDMEKFVALHPVIYKAESLGNNEYLIYEKLKFAGIPVSFRYKAQVVKGPENHVYISATVMGMVRIAMQFRLAEKNGKTEVQEEVHFHTVLPVKSMMGKIFTRQHELLFRNMELATVSDLRV